MLGWVLIAKMKFAQMIKVKDSEIFAMVEHWFFLWLVYWV
jgi:hypothetical protein